METDKTLIAFVTGAVIVACVGIIECNSMERTKAEMRAKCAQHTDTTEELALCTNGAPAVKATFKSGAAKGSNE